MRTRETELGLGSIRIEDIKTNLKSRDDIPSLLLGLQAIHGADDTRERLFELLEHKVEPISWSSISSEMREGCSKELMWSLLCGR